MSRESAPEPAHDPKSQRAEQAQHADDDRQRGPVTSITNPKVTPWSPLEDRRDRARDFLK